MMNNKKITLILAVMFGLTTGTVTMAADETGSEGNGEEATRTAKEVAQTCATCHGEKGISGSDAYPHLAGQHKSYLLQALKDYKSGKREHQVMNSMAANLSEAEMEAVAEYYADMPGGLTTP